MCGARTMLTRTCSCKTAAERRHNRALRSAGWRRGRMRPCPGGGNPYARGHVCHVHRARPPFVHTEQPMKPSPHPVERNIGVVVLVFLLIGCGLVMKPFVSALLWAVVLCIS